MDANQKRKLLEIESKLIDHPFPPQIVLENTSSCDQKCIHCSHKELIRPKRHMETSLHNKIVEEIAKESPATELWPTFYGEALVMGSEIWDRIDYAASVGCTNIVLNSNGGLLLRKDHIDRILKSPLRRFILSLDGFTKETYERIRFLGNHERTYSGVEALLKEKESRGQIYPLIICQYSLIDENENEVEDFKKYWNARGAEVKVRPKLEWTATGSIRSNKIDHNPDFRIACPWGNNTMAIHQDGSVVACAVDYEGKFKVGNINEISIKEAWGLLKERLRLKHKLHQWDQIPDICKGCNDWQTAGAEYEDSNIEGSRPFWFDQSKTVFKIHDSLKNKE